MNWKHIGKSLAAGAVLLLGVGWGPMAAAQAFVFPDGYNTETGGGTRAGTPIVNNATLNFSVNSIDDSIATEIADETVQCDDDLETGSCFVVDRRLNVNVTAEQASNIVEIGEEEVFIRYTITNFSNDVVDILLRAFQQVADVAAAGAQICVEDGTSGTCLGSPTAVNSGSALRLAAMDFNGSSGLTQGTDYTTEDALSVLIFFSSPIPSSGACGDLDTWHLVAAFADDTGAIIQGDTNDNDQYGYATAASDVADNGAVVQNVFADAPGSIALSFDDNTTNTAGAEQQGQHADVTDLVLSAPFMTITKSSRVVFDPINGNGFGFAPLDTPPFDGTSNTAFPKRLPNAIVEYLITVSNNVPDVAPLGCTVASATSVSVEEVLPGTVSVVDVGSLFGIALPDAYISQCDGTPATVAVAASFSASLGASCTNGQTGTVTFYVEID